MKKFSKKVLVLLIAATMLLTVGVGSTVAYLVANTGSITNTFTPGEVNTEIDEKFDGTTKQNIRITNSGTVDVYVRVAVVGNWCDESGNVIEPWTAPENLGTDWTLNDGYYYYTKVLKAHESTSVLFPAEISGVDENRPGQHLKVTVIHQSIQAEPEQARKDAGWPW